jgi:branched-chain amino acid aminotransferase
MTETTFALTLHQTQQPKTKPNWDSLVFGKHFTDHLFVMDWTKDQGWHQAEIRPYSPFSLDPAAMVFHYGQAIFEGLKAYRGTEGQILLFRAADNLHRLNSSAARMCMPAIPVAEVLAALKQLLALDRDWVPSLPGTSLYIRPTMIATEAALGLHAAQRYRLFIICCPVGPYYPEGFKPTKIYVEEQYVRAVQGGVGEAKTSGNYAASLKAFQKAQEQGYTQVLWLDAAQHRYVEEVGTSNIFFVMNGELVTPPLGGTILPGITRNTILQLAADWGIPHAERPISIETVRSAAQDGSLTEAFASGTAAVIAPVGEFYSQGQTIRINQGQIGPLARRFFQYIEQVQRGLVPDPHNWIEPVI